MAGRKLASRAVAPGGQSRTSTLEEKPLSLSGRFIVDNSVWARLNTSPEVASAFRSVVNMASPMSIWVCPPTVAEIGFGARDAASHATLLSQLTTAFWDCPNAPSSADTLRIQSSLWSNGLVRAAGAMDTVIAAYAIANDATLLHYDRDFEYISSVVPVFRQRWIVPRGSV